MKIFLVGATGRSGRRVAAVALERGHAVTALVRSASHRNLVAGVRVVEGNVLSSHDLEQAMSGHDVVISTLGHRTKDDRTLLEEGARSILAAMRSSEVERLIVVSQGLLFPSANPVISLLRVILAKTVTDSIAMERVVAASDVKWTIVRPPRLKDSDNGLHYRAMDDARPKGALAMSRGALAVFLVDEAEQAQFVRRIVGVGER